MIPKVAGYAFAAAKLGGRDCARSDLSERADVIVRFLDAAGWANAGLELLAADASFRRYHRVRRNGATAVLMDAPPHREDIRPFVRVARHLRGLGLSAPTILAAEEACGLLLLEDLGDDTFTRLLATGSNERALYRLAVDVLIHLHRLPVSVAVPSGLPSYDKRRLLDEALLLPDWFLPAVTGRATSDDLRATYVRAWSDALAEVLTRPTTLVLRDFHVDNLMQLAGRQGLEACALLDFQDAVVGPAAYDLMSLLEDARRDVTPAVRSEMLDYYLAEAHSGSATDFTRDFAVLAAQRHAKVIGIFTRLDRRDGKSAYLGHIQRVWRLLSEALRHPALEPVATWFERHVPPDLRRAPAPRCDG
jgi:aminoglycoside/choline kinase family phosphotransferase